MRFVHSTGRGLGLAVRFMTTTSPPAIHAVLKLKRLISIRVETLYFAL
jgi:hypothetical protein